MSLALSGCRLTGTAAVFITIAAFPCAAQPSSLAAAQGRPGVGAQVSRIRTADRNAVSDPGAADFAVNADVPLPSSWRLRAEFGRSRWTFDGNEAYPEVLPPEQISLTRVTASAIVTLDLPGAFYVGGGVGVYKYHAELSDVPRPTRPGLHALGGTEILFRDSGLGLRLEVQFQAVDGPNANSTPGTVVTFDTPPVGRSRVFSETMFNFSAGAGVSWRF